MKFNCAPGRTSTALLALCFAASNLFAAEAAPAPVVDTSSGASQNEEIARLQAALTAQQKQLDILQHTLEQQQKVLERAMESARAPELRPNLGSVTSLTPVIPAPIAAIPSVAFPAAQVPTPAASASASKNPCEAPPDSNAVPPYLRIGSTCIMPVGFMDLTAVWRDKNAGSSLGSNFGSVPYNNAVAGNLSEFRFTPQNSRLGFRADADWKGAHVIGYNEFDFLGTSASNGIGVTNGAFVPRLRLFWVDVRKGEWEVPRRPKLEYADSQSQRHFGSAWRPFLFAGDRRKLHGWSHLDTPTGSPRPLSPQQHCNGRPLAGESRISMPAVRPVDPKSPRRCPRGLSRHTTRRHVHQSISALRTLRRTLSSKSRSIRVQNSTRKWPGSSALSRPYTLATNQHFTKAGGGVSFNANLELLKNFRLVTNNYWSDGGGRYLFGQAPDVILRADGSPSPIHAGGTVDGVEWTIKNTLLYAYYGGIYIGRNTALDANGKSLVGYGFTGSANSQNRAINELTFGFNQTLWKNARYGAINLMGQYEWLQRNPWFVAIGAPKATHDNTIYLNLRYTLPGSMPNF